MRVGVHTCSPDTPIRQLVRFMLDQDEEAVVVMDAGHATGVVSRKELVQAYATGLDENTTADQIMQGGVVQLPPDIPLTAAAQLMLDFGVRAVFLMHHAAGVEYPAAVLTFTHLLRHLGAASMDELSDLGIKAQRRPPVEAFIERRDAARRSRTRG